jgi:hypothetical protein
MTNTTLSPDPQPPPAPKKKSNLPIILGFGCGGLLLLSIIGFFIMAKLGSNVIEIASKEVTAARKSVDSALAMQQDKKSIGISRSTVKDAFSTMNWETGHDIEGSTNYVGTEGDGTIIQLVGPASDLELASYTVTIASDHELAEIITNDALKFVNLIDPSARSWVGDTFSHSVAGEVNDSTVIGSRIFLVSLTNSVASISVKPR